MYDIYGNQIDIAYDIKGNIIYENNPITLEDIPTYFQSDVTNSLNYVDELGSDYAHYIVVTDTHYSSNCGNSSTICNYMYSTGKFDKMIHLGDFLESGAVDGNNWNAMIEADFCHYKQWIMTQGNHDSGIYPFSLATPYFESNEVNYVTHNYKNGFYYDNKEQKIRFIGLHHMLYANSSIRSEIEEFISSMPSDYKWCLINHYPFNNGTWESTSCISSDAQTWLFRLIDTYKGFIGNFCGHMHLDKYDLLSTGTTNFNQITLDADILRSGNQGTSNEQVVTIVSINPTTENVKFYRIGRSLVYESKQWEYTGFTS